MNAITIAIGIAYAYGLVLSIKSIIVLRSRAPWTSIGWALTAAYFVAIFLKYGAALVLPGHGEYVFLVALTIAFIIAGVRDEPQAEPWYWPTFIGKSRAERRANG